MNADEPSRPTREERGFRPSAFFRQHPGIFVSLIVLFTIVLKMMAVAHGSPETIAALLRESGAPDVAIAALLTGTPHLSFLLVIWAIPQFAEAVRERDPLMVPGAALALSVIAVAALAPWHLLVAVLVLATFWILSSLLWAWWSKRKGRRLLGPRNVPRRWEATVAATIGIALAWLIIVFSDRPWLPAEQIALDTGESLVGFVLKEDGAFISVMREPDRGVTRLDAGSVLDRGYCALDDGDPRPLTLLLLGRATPVYPACEVSD